MSSKLGFSVVAPMSVMMPFSTHGKNASCLSVVLEPLFRFLDDLAHAGHAFGHGGKRLEVPVGVVGDDLGERRLAGARRPPEDARPNIAAAYQVAEGFPRAEEMLLAEELIECLGPHARGEGLRGALEEGRLSHDTPSIKVFVTKNTAAPAKNADGSAHPFLS